MLRTKVKAGQIANLTDARYFAAMGVDYLGFSLDPASSAYIDPKNMNTIREWLEGPAIVGEFGVATVESIREAYELLKLDFVQIGPFQETNVLGLLDGIPLMKEIVIDTFTEDQTVKALMDESSEYVRFFILDFIKNGISWTSLKTSNVFRMEVLKDICSKHNVLLSIDLNAEDTEELLDSLQPYGLNLFGGEEEMVGVKSFDDLDLLFDCLM